MVGAGTAIDFARVREVEPEAHSSRLARMNYNIVQTVFKERG